MSQNPTVAILLATYNGEQFLEQQLDSIVSQTYQNFKIYISDDCSSDATVRILQEYQQKFPDKIFYGINKKNIGYVKNFEKLLQGVKEKYIALSDQDDIWQSDKLEIQMSEILEIEDNSQQRAVLIHSDLSMIDDHGNIIENSYFAYRKYKLKNKKDFGHILGPCGVMGNTVIMNENLKKLVLPFPDKLDTHDYWIAISAELFGVRKTLPQQLVKYRIHKSNASNSCVSLRKNKIMLSRNIKLPNINTNRKFFLPQLLKNINNKNDAEILKAYIKYLNFDGNKIILYSQLLKYSLVKRDVRFRIKLFFKILFTDKYDA